MISTTSLTATANSVMKNWVMWLFYLGAVVVVAWDNVLQGVYTFIGLVSGAYFVHRFSHVELNFFTVMHHYHHENNDWLAYLSQILMELLFGVFVVPMSYAGFTAHPWATLLFVLVYSSVHNVNYGIFKVNQVHARHHENVHENIGPDVCDILFQSKHGEVEDTTHYVPNIVAATVIVVLARHFKLITAFAVKVFGAVGIVLYLLASWYVSVGVRTPLRSVHGRNILRRTVKR